MNRKTPEVLNMRFKLFTRSLCVGLMTFSMGVSYCQEDCQKVTVKRTANEEVTIKRESFPLNYYTYDQTTNTCQFTIQAQECVITSINTKNLLPDPCTGTPTWYKTYAVYKNYSVFKGGWKATTLLNHAFLTGCARDHLLRLNTTEYSWSPVANRCSGSGFGSGSGSSGLSNSTASGCKVEQLTRYSWLKQTYKSGWSKYSIDPDDGKEWNYGFMEPVPNWLYDKLSGIGSQEYLPSSTAQCPNFALKQRVGLTCQQVSGGKECSH